MHASRCALAAVASRLGCGGGRRCHERGRAEVIEIEAKSHGLKIHEEKGYQRAHGLHAKLVGAPAELMTLAELDHDPLKASRYITDLFDPRAEERRL